jgi:hypothetical protein
MARQKVLNSDERLTSGEELSEVHHHWTCARCGGLMVTDFGMELVVSQAHLASRAQRCVQCGEVIDSVILENRMLVQTVPSMRGCSPHGSSM